MTDSRNVRTVKRVIERWNTGDRTAPIDDAHPSIEINAAVAGAFRGGEPYRGYDGMREWLATLDESFERWDIAVDQVREQGDVVVVLGSVRSRGRGSGVELDVIIAWVIEFSAGKILRVLILRDHDEALAAAGFSQ